MDGTEIKLAEKPREDPESYFSRKHIYSLKVQCVCDRHLRIRHLVLGYPGSVHDARIYNNCDLAKNPNKFFSENQWIAGDSAYKLTGTVITPFRVNASSGTEERRMKFNRQFSRYRIRIEHTYGLLKERFGSLKELRLQIKNDESVRKACDWIMVCAILHNLAIDQKDDSDLFLFNLISLEADEAERLNVPSASEGELKRNAIMNLMRL